MAISTRDKQLIKRFLKNMPVFRNLSVTRLARLVSDFSIRQAKTGGKDIFPD